MIGEIREERGEERGVYHLDTLELIFFRSFRYNLNGEILLIELGFSHFLPFLSQKKRERRKRLRISVQGSKRSKATRGSTARGLWLSR